MPRQKQVPANREPPDLAESVAKLTEEVGRLADEVRVLRDAIDDFRGEYEWAIRNGKISRPRKKHVVQLQSMAAEAAGPDWKEKLNGTQRQEPPTVALEPMMKMVPPEGQGPTGPKEPVMKMVPPDGQLW